MDFVGIWKVVAIALTGFFGVLGLLKEFKDKETNRVTKWGKLSLAGILISTSFGIVVQFKEQQDSAMSAAESAAQTLELLKNTSGTVDNIERLLTIIDGEKFYISFYVICSDDIWIDFCRAFYEQDQDGKSVSVWEKWPIEVGGTNPNFNLWVKFFREQETADKFAKESGPGARIHLIGDLDYGIRSVGGGQSSDMDVLHWEPGRVLEIFLDIESADQFIKNGNGSILSSSDLAGSSIILSTGLKSLNHMQLSNFTLRLASGFVIQVDGDQFTRIPDGDGREFLRYDIPM